MTLIAVLLILVSSFAHAGWNLLGKSSGAAPAAFVAANLTGAVLLLPAAWALLPLVFNIPRAAWLLLCLTGGFETLYYASISLAYRRGDMSVAYPLSRALPVIFVTAVTLAIGRGEAISPVGLAGFAAIFVGALLVPMRSLSDLSFKIYLKPGLIFAVLAALATAGYSIVDSNALNIVRTESGDNPWRIALVYAFFAAVSSTVWSAAFFTLTGAGRRALRAAWRPAALRDSVVIGVGIYLTYTLVLMSMGFVADISYVVAFRQLSIPIGVFLGLFVLKEAPHIPKLTGTSLMLAGLVLTAVG